MINATITNSPQGATLAHRLREAPLPVPVALRLAVQLAEAMRLAHADGQIAGVLDPAQIIYSNSGAAVLPAQVAFTPYAAPELFQGEAQPDARSDVFAFGALFYHMLTGTQPFPGRTPDELHRSLLTHEARPLETLLDTNGQVPASEYPGLQRILNGCMNKNPEQRWQRMQTVYMELKLLNVAARRVLDPAAGRAKLESALREEIGRIERTFSARLATCDQTVAELQRSSADHSQRVHTALDAHDSVRRSIQTLEESLAQMRETAARLEAGLAEASRTTATVEEALSGQIGTMEEQIYAHTQSIETLHSTVAQTDDLLERVVESFDSLQNFVMGQSEEKSAVPAAPANPFGLQR